MNALEMVRVEAGFIQPNVDFMSAEQALRPNRVRNPFELGMGWLVDLNKNYFTGKKNLINIKKQPLTKKEINMLDRERIKLSDLHRGIKDMKHLPSAIFFVDGIHEKIAINEAYTLGIPVFGMVDSNTDPTPINYPIPSNDDSIKSINAIVGYIADMILEAKGGNKTEVNEDLESVKNGDDANKGKNE